MIGATEEELKEKGVPYEVGRARYENNARGQITGDLDGFVKLVFDPATRKLLGAHLIGGGATELVHIAQMVMLKDGGLDDFLHSVFNFPTLAECFKYAAYDGLQRLSHRQGGAPLARNGRRRGVERRRPSPGARLVRRSRPHRPVRPREPPGDARPHGSVATRSLRHVDLRRRPARG